MIGSDQELILPYASSVMSQGILISCFFVMTAIVHIMLTVLASRQLLRGPGFAHPVSLNGRRSRPETCALQRLCLQETELTRGTTLGSGYG